MAAENCQEDLHSLVKSDFNISLRKFQIILKTMLNLGKIKVGKLLYVYIIFMYKIVVSLISEKNC